MAALSILLAVLSLVCVVIGVLTTPVPVLGAFFSFGAPALALCGIIVGGKAMSRGRQSGASSGAAQAGVIASAIALVPALLTAMTCGVCNAMCASGGHIETHRSFFVGPLAPDRDGGAAAGAPAVPDRAQPAQPRSSRRHDGGRGARPDAPDTPPPAFPPPPIAPGRP